MSRCVITFESPNGVYNSGQLLRGTVVLTTVEPKTISQMYIQALGYSRVRWRGRKKSDKGQTATPAILYSGEEQYLQSKTDVIGNGTNETDTDVLPGGSHTYTFEIPLPKDLPSSFLGKGGYIRYEVVFTIESCQGVIDSFKQPFSVVETLNLNEHPKYKKPILETETKIVYFCFCWNEIIKASCYVPFSGFVPGQKIPLTIKIENKANYQCFGSRLKLERVVKFKSKFPNEETTRETASLSQKQLSRIAMYSTSEYSDFLEVPSTPPSSTRKDRQIDVSYFVSLYIHGAGNRSFEVRFPVTIGTEPLHEEEFQEVPSENREQESESTIPGSRTLALDASPSYTEAMAIESESVDNDTVFEDSVDSPYTPKYPFYNDLPLPSAPPMDEVLKEFEQSNGKSKKYVRAAQDKCRMGVSCEITFDESPDGVFRSGDIISGKVKLTATEATSVQAIYVELYGSGSVWWTEKWGDSEDSFTGKEEYISEKLYILQTAGEQMATLSTGAHVYSFRFELPMKVPSTFQGLNGSIKYKVTVYMEKNGKQFKSFKRPIDVVAVLDLNTDITYKLPLHSENEKQFWWKCCGVDTIKYEIKLMYSAYSTGLPVPFYLIVRNDSTFNCYNSKIQLIQIIEFISKSMREKTISSANVVIEKSLGPISKQTTREIENSLDIPSTLPVSTLDSSSILRVSYLLKFITMVRGCHTKGELVCPIIIGSIPIEDDRKGSSLASSSISELNTIPVRHLMEKRQSFARDLPKWNRNIS